MLTMTLALVALGLVGLVLDHVGHQTDPVDVGPNEAPPAPAGV